MDIYEVLVARYGDKLWELHEFEYDGIIWKDKSPKPTKKELEDQVNDVVYEKELLAIKKQRHSAYISPDGPDAIFMKWQRGEATKEEWEQSIQDVKNMYPYPSSV